jgi:hypothetical protein
MNTCSCSETKGHVVARRSTADGKHVVLHSDGSLTWSLGYSIKNSPFPRTDAQRELALRAGWLVLGEVELHDADAVSSLVAAARWVAERSGLPGDVRRRLAAERGPCPVWEVLSADRDGKATCRVWRLPRMLYPGGLAIWHERGRYDVIRLVNAPAVGARSRDAYETTGFTSTTLRGAMTHVRRMMCD